MTSSATFQGLAVGFPVSLTDGFQDLKFRAFRVVVAGEGRGQGGGEVDEANRHHVLVCACKHCIETACSLAWRSCSFSLGYHTIWLQFATSGESTGTWQHSTSLNAARASLYRYCRSGSTRSKSGEA